MHALWALRVSRGVVDCPLLTPSDPDIDPYVVDESDIDIRS
jgi:hypothetical protein